MKFKTVLILSALLAILLYQNSKLVDFNFLWMNFQIKQWIIIGFSAINGCIIGLILANKQKVGGNTESIQNHLNKEDDEYLK